MVQKFEKTSCDRCGIQYISDSRGTSWNGNVTTIWRLYNKRRQSYEEFCCKECLLQDLKDFMDIDEEYTITTEDLYYQTKIRKDDK